MLLLLPWRSFPTSGHANSFCERKCSPFRRFACALPLPHSCRRGTTYACRPVDAIAVFQDSSGKEEVLVSYSLSVSTIISNSRNGGNTRPLLCEAGHTEDIGHSNVPFVKRAFIGWTVATMLTFGYAHFDKLPPSLQNFPGLGVAHASLVQMPPEFLNNRYYLVRAGESEFERIGVINTNPVTKTNVESGLSENGKKQIVKAALQLREMGACDGSCWIWPSITQRAYQAAEIIAYINNINRSRIVPEYSFLDARGLGAYEGKSLSFLNKIYESDAESISLRPPPYTDGTPNESVADVFVRVTQLMSILETQYFGESIIIVAPDSDNLSILEAALTGFDLRRHSALAFVPGEVRYMDLDDRPPQPRARPSGLVKCKTLSECG